VQTYTLPYGYIARDIKVGSNGVMQLIVYNQQEGDNHHAHPTIALFDSVKGGIDVLDPLYHPKHLSYSNNKMEFLSIVDDDDSQMDFVQLDGATGQMNLRQILPFEDESINWMELTSAATDRYFFLSVSYQKTGNNLTSSAIQVFDLLAK
jgi:hypothetical protein